ncbi:ABC transporter substrate-binding protein [Prauserella muralis]|uniref:Peptide ABC transporter substrate-binding protein n=1 Tax=Prauserella muralis TaxID=588067 RepID=A0A2V4B879_9PSEU|nr:ABC transporter substrate-binding protein [Prauserella muralis]PXY31261.1 peptide ABC transporter substrate-binding protein [Prauserella muralis]TWE14432.1 peptide/nickel transport system substrate-binding protein [Prauserella muralis]
MLHLRVTRMRRTVLIGLAGALAVSLSACAESQRDSGGGQDGGTLVFGATGAPSNFDPFYASDGETFRVTRQLYENLVGIKPGTAELEPELATEWESTPDGKTWTFTLKEGVKFHDGTDFNADAVCKNFERMYNQTGAGATAALSYYWIENFGGFADGKNPSLYKSCTAENPTTVKLELTRFTAGFPTMLSQDSFAMQSPAAMDKYKANDVKAQGDSFVFSEYARSHPTGTGPFKFVSYDEANGTIELQRNDDYHGEKAKLSKLIFRVIEDETARKQALEAGDIDGYDFPAPADWDALKSSGNNLMIRDPFNILYLGITQKNNPALKDLRVRQALAYAIDRQSLVTSVMPEKAEVAKQFYPSTVDGYADDVQEYPYDPDKAKQLLRQAGHENLTVELWWPSQVTRPYMPNPQAIFGAIKEDLEQAGIKVKPISKPWAGGYLDQVEVADAQLFLLGWTGDYNSPDNFIGTFFGTTENQFWTSGSPWGDELAKAIDEADATVDDAEREAKYQEINRKLMSEYLPAIPLSHSPPAIVVSPEVQGLVPSPLTKEEFAPVSMSSSE